MGKLSTLFGLNARYRVEKPQAGISITFDFGKDLGGEISDNMARAGRTDPIGGDVFRGL
jgi:hypothetical protein